MPNMVLEQGMMYLTPHVMQIIRHRCGSRWNGVQVISLASECRHVQSYPAEVADGEAFYRSCGAADAYADVLAVRFEADAVVGQWGEG
jgi:hypothetical protein